MTVGLVGSGPAAEAVEAALSDVDRAVERIGVTDLTDYELGVVIDKTVSGTFERANEIALADGTPWIAVELGAVGGYPVVDASVAGIDPDDACYQCLSARVGSNVDPESEPQAPADAPTARLAGAIAGRLAIQFFESETDPFSRTLVEIPHTEREFLPVPGCVCDGDRDRTLDRDETDRDVQRALELGERAFDQRVGVVSEIGEAESYPVPYYLSNLCDTSEFSDQTASRQAAGVDPNWDAAFMKALGEGLERYCAGVYREGEFLVGTPDEVEDAVSPSAFVSPDPGSDAAPAGRETAETAERMWVDGEDLVSGDRVRLPAELVHYPPPERTIRPAITTGLGLGNSTVEALLSGLYEVIERDAATIAWYSSYEPLELVGEDDPYERLAARAGAHDLDVTALLLTQDVDVPVICVVLQREEWPKFAAATAAHLDPATAARDALAEAIQNWIELRKMGPEDARAASGAIGHFADVPPDSVDFVDVDQRIPAASVGPEEVPSGREHLDELLDRVTERDLDAYAARTTTRDVERLGFEAVRVLVPGAQPLFFGEPYFGERAETAPWDMGYEPALDREHHPYP